MNRKVKVTCEGTVTTLLWVNQENEYDLIFKTVEHCDCSSCQYETLVVVSNIEVKDFCVTQDFLVV